MRHSWHCWHCWHSLPQSLFTPFLSISFLLSVLPFEFCLTELLLLITALHPTPVSDRVYPGGSCLWVISCQAQPYMDPMAPLSVSIDVLTLPRSLSSSTWLINFSFVLECRNKEVKCICLTHPSTNSLGK